MSTYINDGGTWRHVNTVYVNDGGTWRRIQTIYVNDGGTWRQVYVGDVISFAFGDYQFSSGSSATASYQLRSDGFQGRKGVSIGTPWITPQINMSAYECLATVDSGTLTSGTTGSWLNLGTTRSWSKTQSGDGISSVTVTVQIRRVSDGVVVFTDQGTLTGEVSSA